MKRQNRQQRQNRHIDQICAFFAAAAVALFALAVIMALTGCAYTIQKVHTEAAGTNGVLEVRSTTSKAVAWGDARQVLEKLKVSNGKTQSIGLDAAESSTSTTNIGANLQALTELLRAMKP